MNIRVASTGSCLPTKQIRNSDFTQFPRNAIPLIEQKTGITSRFHCGEGETSSTLAIQAAQQCLRKVGLDASQLDAVILASSTPDRLIPATATKVAHAIGAANAFAFDVNSVCSGGIVLLEIARSLISAGSASNVLVIAVDTYSKFLNPTDFTTTPYFGDGAGAVLVSAVHDGMTLLGGILHTDGGGYETISIKAGGGEFPFSQGPDINDCYFKMNGRVVFEFATQRGAEVIQEVLNKHSLDVAAVSKFILHQANINILKEISSRIAAPMEKFFTNLQQVGNTASASVFIALDQYFTQTSSNNINGVITLASFGGGLTWGACVLAGNH